MKLNCPSQVNFGQAELVCRQSRVQGTLAQGLLVCILVGAAVMWQAYGEDVAIV